MAGSVRHKGWRNAYAMFSFSLMAAGQTDIMTINYAAQFPACDLSWNSRSLCEWRPGEGRSRWTRRTSCPWTEPATCIPLIKSLCPRSWPLLQSAELHSLGAWSCMELDSWTGKEIIAIDQREEVRRPQDKLLCCWMTSISSPVTWNNEWCWGGTNGHMRIYGGLLCLSSPSRVTGCATVSLLFVFVPAPILSRGFCLSSKVISSWASGGGASSPSGQLISSGNTQSMRSVWVKDSPQTSGPWSSIAVILVSCGFGVGKHQALFMRISTWGVALMC